MLLVRDVLVVDFSKLLPGPFCTMILADLGCRVVRVELPHFSDWSREAEPRIKGQGSAYWMLNRNKESVCLDFRKPEGLAALRRLLEKADVVVEGFRPGMMEKLGVSEPVLRRRNKRLVYCSIAGYGDGPRARRAGHDLNFQALAGLLALGDSSGEVTFPPVQLADLSAAHYAATAILAALLEREKTGKGRHVKVSMAEAVFTWPVFALGEWLATRAVPERRSAWWNGRNPLYRLYRTEDGRHVAVAILEKSFAVDLLRRIGREELLPRLDAEGAGEDDVLARELEITFSRRTLAEWDRLLGDKDVCVTPVLTLEETLRDPHWSAVGMLAGPGRRYVRSPISDGRPFKVRRTPPKLGADTRRVLRDAGLSAVEIRRLEKGGLLGRK
ncbi:MAG: CoA transferase [Elusimicrobia bacterium]|nr:CoA transferase [Elusimicrobiota bacterium]